MAPHQPTTPPLLVVPDSAAGFWPWKLDAFHAQRYSVTFLTPATGVWLLLRRLSSDERVALGATLAAWGGLPIAGLSIADASTLRVSWTSAGTWGWFALFPAMIAAGVWVAASASP